jgi:primosomal protein N' (replication factor Y)
MALSYAEVSVNSPAGKRQLFSYSIPISLSVCPGQAVWVPFGNYILQGIVVSISQFPSVESVRPIDSLIQSAPVLSPSSLKLAQWISSYYLSSLFSAISLFLPPGFERQPLTYISTTGKELPDNNILSKDVIQALNLIQKYSIIKFKQLEKVLGKKTAQKAVSQLVERGLAQRCYKMEEEKIKSRVENYVTLNPAATIETIIEQLRFKRAVKQLALVKYLQQQNTPVPLASVMHAGFSRTVIKQLTLQNLAAIEKTEVKREPIDYAHIRCNQPLTLTTAQQVALQAITGNLKSDRSGVFVLHGVTGSGKTEVYLQALEQTVKLGKKGLVLVPEIALTPQTIERFAGRFPHRVAVLHSHLSLGEQFDQWHSIQHGDFDVVIGARSAIFAPQPQIGLIVIDEEHEWTYKQQEQSPYYHTRNVAIKLAELTGSTVVLGSATPDIETYYNTQNGNYTLLEMPQHITSIQNTPPTSIELVDLRKELKDGNRSIFSRRLHEAITQALAHNEQVILFFNRRGSASFVQCRTCSMVVHCRRCQIPMSYHSAEESLVCHQCNYRQPVPAVCPRCHSRRIKFLGIGTQKLEEETAKEFPQARLLRWDSDVTRTRHAHDVIMDQLKSRQVDILIGTQMVAKGLDLPHITLVGVVSADTSLNLPDIRAGERTFQLLTQVAGRAGRGSKQGKVIIQTYSPEHYAIQAILKQNYAAFYRQETEYRRQLDAPPFSQLVRLTYTHTNEIAAQTEAERLKRQLTEYIASAGIIDIQISGPAPAFIARLRGRYRWQMTLRGAQPARVLAATEIPSSWSVDIDPLGIN